uniref:Uncharacterized protein n=1 Tax=Capra hircus TaxID=9925 RepID=A0A8C2QSF8_CAPHI
CGRGNWKLGGGACAPATVRVLPAIESECLVITVPPLVRRGTTESLGCRVRVAARASGSREWKQKTRAETPPKGRKRKPRTTEPKTPVEPPKPAEAKKSGKSTKSKEKQEKITDTFKVKRKVDRFNGVSEAELLTKTLPDILTFNLDIVIVRILSSFGFISSTGGLT